MSSTKINVAVAGVSSGLGTTIANALASNPSVTLTLLTRSSSSSIADVLQPLVNQGAILRTVNYSSADSVAEALRGIHTVISTIFTPGDSTPADILLEGAKVAGVKRFVPSEFSIAKGAKIGAHASKVSHWRKVQNSGMEYTAFRVGMFMDYLATGSPLYDGPLPTHKMYSFIVNVKEHTAELPGSGNDKITLTTVADIGKFVNAAVSLDKWPEELGMSGETLSFNDIIKKAEDATGEKFTVSYIDDAENQKRRVESQERNDLLGYTVTEFHDAVIEGKGEIREPYLNKATDVQPMGVTEFLQKYWEKAKGSEYGA